MHKSGFSRRAYQTFTYLFALPPRNPPFTILTYPCHDPEADCSTTPCFRAVVEEASGLIGSTEEGVAKHQTFVIDRDV